MNTVITEELMKYLLFSLFINYQPWPDSRLKITGALMMGLIFAIVENSFYIIRPLLLLRLFSTLPLHLITSYYMARYRKGIVLSVLLHLAFNYLISLSGALSLLTIPLLLFFLCHSIISYQESFSFKKTNKKIDFFK